MYEKDLNFLLEEKNNEIAHVSFETRSSPSFIPIVLTGGIGDVIMDGQTVKFLLEKYPVLVYTKHIQAFRYFYPDIPVSTDLHPYDWHIDFNTVFRFKFTEGFSGFLIPEHKLLFEEQCTSMRSNKDTHRLSYKSPLYDSLLARFSRDFGIDRRSFADFAMGWGYRKYEYWPRDQPADYITIHDGYDAGMQIEGPRSTKQWPLDSWVTLVKALKYQFPQYKIIQLGSKNGRPIDGVDQCLLNKTTITGAFEWLKHSRLHIDGDSGLVHAATKMSVPCVVMFGPTPDYFYGYTQNVNLKSKACEGACYWIKENWMEKCVLGYKSPKCMDDIDPEYVFEAAVRLLK